MTDKPNPFFHLAEHGVLALRGRDAAAFAQAQFMSDVAALDDGRWHWSGWLTAQGRVVALFALLRLAGDELRLVLPDADAAQLADALRRFVFRSKLAIETTALACNGRFALPEAARGNACAQLDDGTLELDLGGLSGPRTLRITPVAAPADAQAKLAWRGFDLRHGLPRLSGEPRWTPQQLALGRLHAFSIRKGCYPGQEIVARTHFLGQAKRTLALFEGDAPLAPGDAVTSGEAGGSVVSVAEGCALAVVGTDAPDTGWSAAGQSLQRSALLDGLAR